MIINTFEKERKEAVKRLNDECMGITLYLNPDDLYNNYYLWSFDEKKVSANKYQKVVSYQHKFPNRLGEFNMYDIVVQKTINDYTQIFEVVDFIKQ